MKVSVNRISQLVHGENGKTGLLQKLPGFDVEKVTLKEEDKNVQKVRLVLKDYDRFKGLDAIVTLEEDDSKDRKGGVSGKLTGSNDSRKLPSKLVSNIEDIRERDFTRLFQRIRKFNFYFEPEKRLIYLRGRSR